MKAKIYKIIAIVLAALGLSGSVYLSASADVMETRESQRPSQVKPCPPKKKAVKKPAPKPKPKPKPPAKKKVVTKKVVKEKEKPVVKTVVREVPKIITKEKVVEKPVVTQSQEQSQQQSVNVDVDQVTQVPQAREVSLAPEKAVPAAVPAATPAVQPEQPAELPVTGAKDALAGAFSITTLAGSIISYRKSKKELNNVINKK